MSHLLKGKTKITSIDILKKAIGNMPLLKFNEGATDFKWYYNKERAESQYGKIEHSISFVDPKKSTSCGYEIGVCKDKDSGEWVLAFDPHDSMAASHVGQQCEKIAEQYVRAYAQQIAEQHGFMVQVTDTNGELSFDLTSIN